MHAWAEGLQCRCNSAAVSVRRGGEATCEEDADEEAPADVVEDLVPHAAAALVAALRHVQHRVPPQHLRTSHRHTPQHTILGFRLAPTQGRHIGCGWVAILDCHKGRCSIAGSI